MLLRSAVTAAKRKTQKNSQNMIVLISYRYWTFKNKSIFKRLLADLTKKKN